MPKDITLADQIKELKRELDTRQRVYPIWSSGPSPKLKPAVAAHRIACIEASIVVLEELNSRQSGQQSTLF